MNNSLKLKILFFLLLFPLASADILYNISIENKNAVIDAEYDLFSEFDVSSWNVSLIVPENSEIISVKDSKTEITGFSLEGEKLELKTHTGKPRKEEKIFLKFKVPEIVEESNELKSLILSLAGFNGVKTKVSANIPDLLSASSSFGFSEKLSEDSLNLEGFGPVNFKAFFGNGKKFENFELFGLNYDLSKADGLFYVIESVTGRKKPFERFPVIIAPDSEYIAEVNEFSAGNYQFGGLISLRESVFKNNDSDLYFLEGENAVSTLLHEAAHGFNEKVLRWNNFKKAWFDEGAATLIEFIADRKEKAKHPQVFGIEEKFIEGNYEITINSKGTKNDLFDYYEKNENFMEAWDPFTENGENEREFGYAFSELLFRKYLKEKGIEKLREAYSSISEINEEAESQQQANEFLLNALQTDLAPCRFKEKTDLSSCTSEVNKFTPTVNRFITGSNIEIIIEPEAIKQEPAEETGTDAEAIEEKEVSENIKDSVPETIEEIKEPEIIAEPIKEAEEENFLIKILNSILNFFFSFFG